jgi:hypothetical protein
MEIPTMSNKKSSRAIMSRDEYEEKFGSLQPMEASKGKWHSGISAEHLQRLDEIQEKISNKIDETVISVARARLYIGDLLNQAREIFPGDLEFGKWRKAVLPNLAPRTCTAYMAMAREFKDAPSLVEAMGWSTARELISAPEDVKSEVKSKVAEGEVITKEEIKESKSKAKPTSAPQPSGADRPSTPPPEQVESSAKRKKSLDQRIEEFIDKPSQYRMENAKQDFGDELDDYSIAAMIFGFSPGILDGRPNMDVWLHVYDFVRGQLDDETKGELDHWYTTIKEAW